MNTEIIKVYKTITLKCKLCGNIKIDYHFEGYDGELSIPVGICPTLKDVAKYYKELVGESYHKATGCNLKEMFKKEYIYPNHLSIDECGTKEAKKHKTLNAIECWCEQV